MFDLINDRNTLSGKIDSCARSDATLRERIAVAAASAFAHAAEHGDLTLASKLVNRVKTASTKAALRRYFAHFGPISWNKKEQQFRKVKKGGAFDPAALDTYFDAELPKAEREPAAYDRNKVLAQQIKSLTTAMERADLAGDSEAAELYMAVIDSLETAKVEQAKAA